MVQAVHGFRYIPVAARCDWPFALTTGREKTAPPPQRTDRAPVDPLRALMWMGSCFTVTGSFISCFGLNMQKLAITRLREHARAHEHAQLHGTPDVHTRTHKVQARMQLRAT